MKRAVPSLLFGLVIAWSPLLAQGPGSAGIHLDLLADNTSTHAAIADVPGAPGSLTGIAPGAVGNPYCAYATPFSPIRFRLSIAPSTLGAAPLGPGSLVSLLWSIGTPNIPLAAPPGSIPPANPGPWIVSVLPIGGALVDGLGVFGPPPFFPPVDPGHPSKLEIATLFPFGAGPPVIVQAVILTPGGLLGVSNGISILAGANPGETSLIPSMVMAANCPFLPTDEGGASFPTPPGYSFYGTPVASAVARANGVIEFGPFANQECDFIPAATGLGCPIAGPEASPRIAVNFFDTDLNGVANPLLPPDLTIEVAPPTATSPSRTIVRWKHASPWFGPFGTPSSQWASSVCELWGSDVPFASPAVSGTVVVVRQEHRVTTSDAAHGFLGIGPGDAGQGFTGPPSSCTGLNLAALFGSPGYSGAIGEAIFLDQWGASAPGDSIVLSNLATAFTPTPGGAYLVTVH